MNTGTAFFDEAEQLLKSIKSSFEQGMIERDLALSIIVNHDPEKFSKCRKINYVEDEYIYDIIDGSKYFYLIYKSEKILARIRITGELYHDFGCEECICKSTDHFDSVPTPVILTDLIQSYNERKLYTDASQLPTLEEYFKDQFYKQHFNAIISDIKTIDDYVFNNNSDHEDLRERYYEIIGDLKNLKYHIDHLKSK